MEALSTRTNLINSKVVPAVQFHFRNLVEMMEERGLSIAHTTIMRWVHQYGPQDIILNQQMTRGESMKPILK